MSTVGVIVGIDKNNNITMYRVLQAQVSKKAENQYDWKFNCTMMNEQQLLGALSSGHNFLNATLDRNSKGKVTIKGKSGSLDRFNSNGKNHSPVVILSQIQNDDGKLIGYKIANYDGNVKNVVLKEMIAYGNRSTRDGDTPVQNAIFVPAEEDRAAHFKSYPNCNFIVEVIKSNKNTHTQVKRVNTQQNKKTLSRLEEIYNPDQIRQLKIGKQEGVDIKIYANPALSAEQMAVLRGGLNHKVNVRPLAFPEFDVVLMSLYIDDLENGLDIRKYLNPKYSLEQLAQLSLAAEEGLDLSKMSNPKLSATEMSEIRERLERNIWKDELVKKDGTWY